ncbi:MAG: AI-2E family transporter [Alphaproteobacteria bacterium]
MTRPTNHTIAAWILAGCGLVAVVKLGILAALLSGLLVYELVHTIAGKQGRIGVTHKMSKTVAFVLLVSGTIALLTVGIAALVTMFTNSSDSFVALLGKMADVIETARSHIPKWIRASVPSNLDELETMVSQWLRAHARELQTIGEDFGRVLVHILIGMIIGGLVAIGDVIPHETRRPLARALAERAEFLGTAFRRVVFAQVRISALNTILTGLYLFVLLPSFGVQLPFKKTIVVVTFIAGLLPVIGNLISNTVNVIVSFSVSPYVAMASLVFLIVIHKLEYFVNARIVGGRIHARAWEILIAMLVMESAFGIPGVIAAPIYYAYLKDELSARKLI